MKVTLKSIRKVSPQCIYSLSKYKKVSYVLFFRIINSDSDSYSNSTIGKEV